jgi:DNA-binding transcriptional regulator YiaG
MDWIGRFEVVAEFGWSHQVIDRWRRACPLLGRPLRARKEASSRRVFVYRPDLEAIAAGDPEWLSTSECARRLGIPRGTVESWIHHECALLGRRLKTRLAPGMLRSGTFRPRLRWIHVSEVDEIRRAREAASTEAEWLPVRVFADLCSVSRAAVVAWIQKQRCPRLDRRLRCEQRYIGRRRQWCVHRSEVEAMPPMQPIEPGWIPVAEFARRCGYRDTACVKRWSFVGRSPLGPFRAKLQSGAGADGRRMPRMLFVHEDEVEPIRQMRLNGRLAGFPAAVLTDVPPASIGEVIRVVVTDPDLPPKRVCEKAGVQRDEGYAVLRWLQSVGVYRKLRDSGDSPVDGVTQDQFERLSRAYEALGSNASKRKLAERAGVRFTAASRFVDARNGG